MAGRGTEQEARCRVAVAWVNVLTGVSVESFREPAGALHVGDDRYLTHMDRPIAIQLAFRGDLEGARRVVSRLIEGADERGEIGAFVGRLQLCEFALRAGDIAEAQRLIDEMQQWTALSKARIVYARLNALVSAIKGDPAAANRAALVVLEQDPDAVTGWDRLETIRALGVAALLTRDYETAVRHLGAVWQQCERAGVLDPGAFPVAGDLVEALVGHGALADAVAVAARLEVLANDQRHPWGLATVFRTRAVIAAASGSSSGEPREDLAAAAAEYARLGLDFERARCLTQLGVLHRRANKRALARTVLDEAAEVLDRLGCDGWAAHARDERSRVSGRRASGGADDLTEGEQRVVELAAAGMSNKEIASTLFVSVATVEAHLTHAYAKLRVRSRSQLATRLTTG